MGLGQSKLQFKMLSAIFYLSFISIFSLFFSPLCAKVDPPNYNFSFEILELFKPGTSLSDIQKKWGDGEIMEKNNNSEMRKYYIAHVRYKFPVLVQFFESKITDSYARLPSYFLHDVFHQTLINRLGPQNSFSNKDQTSLYQWIDKDGIIYQYEGACTITCFPLYFSMELENFPKGAEMIKPIHNKLLQSKL